MTIAVDWDILQTNQTKSAMSMEVVSSVDLLVIVTEQVDLRQLVESYKDKLSHHLALRTIYSKICVIKRPLKNRQNKYLNEK